MTGVEVTGVGSPSGLRPERRKGERREGDKARAGVALSTRVITESVPTEYAGIRFRSRLEARWAVFLTEAGIRWAYEPRVLAVPVPRRHVIMPYLPDLWLPDRASWPRSRGFLYDDGFRRLLDIANGLPGFDLVISGNFLSVR